MIDVREMTQAIILAAQRGDDPVREATLGLAQCWDACSDEMDGSNLSPKNPYRDILRTPDNLSEPSFVEVPTPTPGHTRRQFTVTVDDDELAAMQIIVAALDELDERTQRRVIRYLGDRINHETGALS